MDRLTEFLVDSTFNNKCCTLLGQISHRDECLTMRLYLLERLGLQQKGMNVSDVLHETA